MLLILALAYVNWPASNKVHLLADKIIIHKANRQLVLLNSGNIIASYQISLGTAPLGQKFTEGDGKTPEGLYAIDSKNSHSKFHLALHVSYPNLEQVALAKHEGRDPGGMIMIHSIMNGLGWMGRFQRLMNWTAGCIALTNFEIEQVFNAVPLGAPVEILP